MASSDSICIKEELDGTSSSLGSIGQTEELRAGLCQAESTTAASISTCIKQETQDASFCVLPQTNAYPGEVVISCLPESSVAVRDPVYIEELQDTGDSSLPGNHTANKEVVMSTNAASYPTNRTSWTDDEARCLISIWEASLGELRRQKRNGRVYQDIANQLEALGIQKSKAQVHGKIENMTQKYRRVNRSLRTGSRAITWNLYWPIHKFLGTLPANDVSLVEESQAQPEESRPEHTDEIPDLALCQEVASEGSPAVPSPDHESYAREISDRTARQPPRKRRQTKAVDVLKWILKENKALHRSLVEARNREFELRTKQLELQRDANETQKRLVSCLERLVEKQGRQAS